MNQIEAMKKSLLRKAEEETDDGIPRDERVTSIVIIVICILIGLFMAAHQVLSTGFFTPAFGTLEVLLLYGSLVYWFTTSAVLLLGKKDLSRDIDSFGGLIFATIGIAWLVVVFPFDFTYFPDVLPDFLRILLRWISNDIALMLMVLAAIVHMVAAIYTAILRVLVRKARGRIG